MEYAQANKFDPLVPGNWYSQKKANIIVTKVSPNLPPSLPSHRLPLFHILLPSPQTTSFITNFVHVRVAAMCFLFMKEVL